MIEIQNRFEHLNLVFQKLFRPALARIDGYELIQLKFSYSGIC
jgi:hypothetical protein